MPRVICPFCLQPHETGVLPRFTCPRHGEVLPGAYIEQYERVPPLWLVTVGFPGHGKTTYLAALTLTLEHISNLWPKSYCRSLDQYTMEARRGWMRAARLGEQQGATARSTLRPLLINVADLPERGNRCLVMYDVAGEVYDRLDDLEAHVAAIRHVSTTWFFVSLDDLDRQDHTLSELFTVYLAGLENLHADLEGRNLIVVYTKGDRLHAPAIRKYLQDDPLQALTLPDGGASLGRGGLAGYYAEMDAMSALLREHTLRHVPGGKAFINMVEGHRMRLAFSVTSALGGDPDPSTSLREDARRFRILDPFLWAVRLEGPLATRQLSLVLDASPGAEGIYSEALLGELWGQLNTVGDVATYSLGARRPLAPPGQSPPLVAPAMARPRLAGPILEQLPADSRALVLTAGPVLDLDDYLLPEWEDRLLIAGLGCEPTRDWRHTRVHRVGESVSALVEALLKLPARAK